MLIHLCGALVPISSHEKLKYGNLKENSTKEYLVFGYRFDSITWRVNGKQCHLSFITQTYEMTYNKHLEKIKSRLNRLSIFLAFALKCKATKRSMGSKKVTKSHFMIGESMTEKNVDSLTAWLGGKIKTGFSWAPASQAMSGSRILEWNYQLLRYTKKPSGKEILVFLANYLPLQ